MNSEIKARWIAALRSGEYRQGSDVLMNADQQTYCCLGVLCALAEQEGDVLSDVRVEIREGYERRVYDDQSEYLPRGVQEWAGLQSSNPSVLFASDGGDDGLAQLAELNDGGHSFETIAQLIEEQL